MIKRDGESSIYYPDKPNRTLSLENCIQRIFTNEKAPLRLNLSKIIELRNTSTHFITEEYEMVYVPLLQACVYNFIEKMKELHGINMEEVIPYNFINLPVKLSYYDENSLRGKYSKQIAERLVSVGENISKMTEQNNINFAIRLDHFYYNTKNKNEATEFYYIDSKAEAGVRVIKELKNPNETHKYTQKKCIESIKKRLEKDNIQLLLNGEAVTFNKYHFGLFVSYYGLKTNEKFCFVHTVPSDAYTYSQQAIDFIYAEIKKDPKGILDKLKKSTKKANPGSKGF